MRELIGERLPSPQSVLSRQEAIAWFAQRYPRVKRGTVAAHLLRFATNEPTRLHYNHRPGEDDLLYKIQPGLYRLYDPLVDPRPITTEQVVRPSRPEPAPTDENSEEDDREDTREFAYERDLRNYLSKNLGCLEAGLRLYEDEDINGIEFPVGGRFIDILAVSQHNEYVVIELKVSRGYDRVVGQLLRYISWIERNHAESDQPVRGIIVARQISEDLKLACSRLADVSLFEYDLQVQVKKVSLPALGTPNTR
jgi:hypothetical protein